MIAATLPADCAATSPSRESDSSVLIRYAFVTWLAVLVNLFPAIRRIEYSGAFTPVFVAVVYLTYAAIYLAPVFVPLLLVDWLAVRRPLGSFCRRLGIPMRAIICVAAVLGAGLLQVLVFADQFIHGLYGFHINGFVWNLLFTRGGIDSLGGGESSTISFALIIGAIFAGQALVFAAIIRAAPIRFALGRIVTRRSVIIAAALFVTATAFERMAYGICALRGYRPVLIASNAFPMYLPTTLNGLAARMGIRVERPASARLNMESVQLRYPAHPIERRPVEKPLNIVWLVSESLRIDMIDPEIMPRTHALAQQSWWFRNHYSGGNGTRMAMFSMFYGLYGNFWFPFLDEHRGPVLIDVLLDAGYQMKLFTSAKFTYPEFDQTIFVRLPSDLLHEGRMQPPWRRDRENVENIIEFLDHRDPARPFLTFMFFESPHAKYWFPEENAIRRPYADDINYATMDLNRDIGQIKNRYINACNHLDSQIARILDYLAQQRLMDSTMVIVTGDHGEEFMEKGRWGHNSAFTEEQIRPPLIIWAPGEGHREITEMTSHLDIPATLMPRLGVTNPPSDHSFGFDLFSEPRRDHVIVGDWNSLAYVDHEFKAVFPLKAYGFADQSVTTRDDAVLNQTPAIAERRKQAMLHIMNDMRTFSR